MVVPKKETTEVQRIMQWDNEKGKIREEN